MKVKNIRSQELVIGGWQSGKGRRANKIGSLLVGYNEGKGAMRRLRYAGKVGTGFTDEVLRYLAEQLKPLQQHESPFAGRQPPRDAVFVEPRLVAEIEFNEWTSAGTLRHPSFKGLRDDKDAAEVIREQPAAPR